MKPAPSFVNQPAAMLSSSIKLLLSHNVQVSIFTREKVA